MKTKFAIDRSVLSCNFRVKTFLFYLLIFPILFMSTHSKAQSGIYESYAILDTGSGNVNYNLLANTGNPYFAGNLGTYQTGDTFVLRGAHIKTYKCNSDNILNGQIYYRIYESSAWPLPPFSNVINGSTTYLGHISDDGTGPECGNTSLRQTWENSGFNLDILQGLTSGDYTIDLYLVAEYNLGTPPNALRYDDNGGSYYRGYFRIDNPPNAVCQDITVQLDAFGNASIVAADIDGGSSDDLMGMPLLSIDPLESSFDCSDIGTPVTVTLTVMDFSMQTDTCTAIVTVVDNIAPTPDAATLADVTAECEVISLTPPTATDNCGGTVTVTHDATLPISTQGTTVVTWTYDDGNGNTSTQTQNVIIDDITAPTPDAATLADVTAECEVISLTPPTATDNCGGTVTVTHDATLPISTQGTTVVTWTYDDGNGNTSTQTQNVVIDDVTAPTPDAATLADVTAECEVTSLTAPTATDNCGGTVTVTNDATLPITAQGTTVVTWTYDDGNGNTSTQTQNVIIDDITAPTPDAATLADVTAECEVISLTPPTATDNCGGTVTVTHDATLPISTQGTTVVTWTYDDGNGNTSTQTQNVVIDDVTAPTPDAATLADVTAECEVTSLTAPTATDNCGGTVTVTNDATLPITAQGTTVVTWTYDDGNGNASTQAQNVVIDDVTPPTPDVATLADVTAQCEVTSLAAPTAADNCGGTVTVTHNATLPITAQGITVVTWTYDDGNGNTSTQAQNVVIDDVTPPTPDVATLSDVTAQCEVTSLTAPTATDNCGGTVTVTHNATLPITAQGTTVVTWTYDDGNGNTSTQAQNVIIDDVTAPTPDIVTLTDVIAECEVTSLTAPTATDNCGGTVTVTNDATLPITAQGITVVTWTYTDVNGNPSIQTQNVVIDDITAPTISCPSNITISNDAGLCSAVVTYLTPTSTDNCGATTTIQTAGLASGSAFPVGTTTNTFQVTDAGGNITTCSFTVTVNDTEAPTITCSSDITVSADADCEATSVSLVAPTTSDNCGVASVTNNAPASFPLGNTVVTWTVTDTAGLTATCTQTVTVNDTTPPTITCPVDIIINTDTNLCTASGVNLGTPTVGDNCGAGYTNDAPAVFPIGDTTVTWTATDGNGNIATCEQLITVVDNQAPTALCQNLSFTIDSTTTLPISITANDIDNGSFDNCGSVSLSLSQTSFDCSAIGTNTVTLTVTDTAGNISTCNATVTIIDAAAGASVSISATPTSPICQGTSISFTATAVNGGTSPSYQWFVNGNPIGPNAAVFTTTSLNHNDQVYVQMTSSASVCSTPQQSNTVTMAVNPVLPVSFNLSSSDSDNIICTGDSVQFIVSSLTNGGTSPIYQWFINGNPVGTNSPSYTSATLANGDIVSVHIISNATCANPIPQTQSVTMTVNPVPTVTALANGSSTNITICEGTSLTLTGSGATTYNWSNGVPNGTSFIPTSGTHVYTVTGTNPNGCSNTDSITVTVNPNPIITLLTSNNHQEICGPNPNQSINNINYSILNADSIDVSGLPSGVTYNYNTSTNILTISGNPISSTLATYNYTVTASNNTCSSPGVIATGSIKVYNGPPSTPNQIEGITVICPTTTTTYTVNYNANAQYYEWDIPAGFTILSGAGTNTITVEIDNNFNPQWFELYRKRLRVRAINPCGSSNWRSTWIYRNPFQSIGLDAGPDEIICQDQSIDLFGNIIDQQIIVDNDLTFSWSDNGAGGTFSNYSNYNLNVTYTPPSISTTTDISISLIAHFPSFLCGGNDVSSQMLLTVKTNPIATITNPSTICYGESVTVTGTPNTTVFYNFNGNPSSFTLGASGSQTFNGLPTGTYTLTSVQYTNTPNCNTPLIGESVTINQAPTVNAGSDQTICSSDTVTLSASLGGTNYSGTWNTSGSGSFSNNSPTAVYTPSAADIFNGTVTLTYTNTPSDGICGAVSDSMEVTIYEVPSITTQPQSVNVCEGENVTLSVVAQGDNLSYQWYENGNPTGTNTSSLTLTNVTANGTYYVAITGAAACGGAITSDTITVTVHELSITGQPLSQTVCQGQSVTFTSTVSGANGYQWLFNGNPIPGAFGSSYTINSVTAGNAGNYSLQANSNYCNSVTSTTATLTVTPPPTVTLTYGATSYCETSSNVNPNLTGTNAYTGGSYSSNPAGLSINASGVINPGASAPGTYTVTYTTPASGGCTAVQTNTTVTIYEVNAPAVAGTVTTGTTCDNTTVTLGANAVTATGAIGLWTVTSGQPAGSYSFSNALSPTSTFTGESGETYTLQWTITNAGSCGNTSDSVSFSFADCGSNINFDGINDNVAFEDNFNLNGDFSIEIWVKPNVTDGTIKTILSKRNANNLNTGYDLRYVNNTVQFRWNGGGQVSANNINTNRWYHIAVVHSGTTYTIYVDGIPRASNTGAAPTNNTMDFVLGAMDRLNNTPTNFFNGWLDELRIWNTALTEGQIREMMNQEIQANGGNVRGSIIPLDITGGLSWSNLVAYYQMNQTTDVSGGYLTNNIGGIDGKLRNILSSQEESAPLPYVSISGGNWDAATTWNASSVQQVPHTNGTVATPVTWNIVRTQHDVNSGNRATTVLGLLVDNNRYSITNDQRLDVNKYLKIDGVLDLEGESQLLQPDGSYVDYSGTGYLERDQQGTGNRFNYNYWGSPVTTGGSTGVLNSSETRTFSVNGIFNTGGTQVNWTTGHNGSTTPLTLSNYWLYLFNGPSDDYNAWQSINQNTSINAGRGFTMKGTGNVGDPDQNYSFKGQPNTGTITENVAVGNEILVGNPYPSAIDAHEFIRDNIPSGNPGTTASIDGSLRYWRQSTTNSSHYLSAYEGGYAYYTIIGGAPYTTPPQIAGTGDAGSFIPQRYIPIGQGFFVYGVTGGDVQFKNSQRVFVKESGGNSIFLRNSNPNVGNESTTEEEEDLIKRIRFDYTTSANSVRHLLLGFTPNNEASDGFDYGYDALNGDTYPSDMSFVINTNKYIIQGVGEFDSTKMYPVAIVQAQAGNVELTVTEIENFDEAINVYLFDSQLGTYTKINDDLSYQANLPAGTYSNRFYIAFQEDNALDVVEEQLSQIQVSYLQQSQDILIKVPASINVKQVYLVNMLGQTVRSWNATNTSLGAETRLPVKNISEGSYIITVHSDSGGSTSKKVVIKQ